MAFQKPKFLYDNRFADATPVASSTASGDFNVLNLRDWRPYTWWKPVSLAAAQTVTVDCGSVKAADYALVWGHDLSTQGTVFEVLGSNDFFVANSVVVATKTPTNDDPFLLTWPSVSYRYWRFRITGTTAPSIAIAAIGAALEMPEYLSDGFGPLNRKAEGDFNRTNKGHALGRAIEFEEWEAQLEFDWVTWSFLRNIFRPAWDAHLRSTPFVFAWDAGDHADEIYLVNSRGQYKAPHKAGQYATLSLDVFGVAP